MMNLGKIRSAMPEGARNVRDLTRAAYTKWIPIINREPKPMTADYDHAIREHIVEVYQQNERVLALIEIIKNSDYLLIENLAVHPDHQGKGLGNILLGHAEKLTVKHSLKELRLYTNVAFSSNIEYYERRGFVEFAREKIASGGELVHMYKNIL